MKVVPNCTLIVVAGLSGTGKTTISTELSKRLGCTLLCKDDIKKILTAAYGAPPRKPIAIVKKLAESQLRLGIGVIVDSTFAYYSDRQWLEKCESKFGAKVILIECIATMEVRKKRILSRKRHGCHLEMDKKQIKNMGRYKFNLTWKSNKWIKIYTEKKILPNIRYIISQIAKIEVGNNEL